MHSEAKRKQKIVDQKKSASDRKEHLNAANLANTSLTDNNGSNTNDKSPSKTLNHKKNSHGLTDEEKLNLLVGTRSETATKKNEEKTHLAIEFNNGIDYILIEDSNSSD